MARESYCDELTALRESVLDLGEDVVGQLEAALDALADDDEVRARAVVDGDRAINERHLALESDCVDLFALQQPVASDLRLVAGSFKILTDLERIGDLAVNLAEYARAGDGRHLDPVDVRAIGEETVALVEEALDAYDREDVAACRTVAERDDRVDALCQRAGERIVRDLLDRSADAWHDRRETGEDAGRAATGDGRRTVDGDAPSRRADDSDRTRTVDDGDPGRTVHGADPWAAESLMGDVSRALLTVRDLERVGDHAVNVAARTLYVAENDPSLV